MQRNAAAAEGRIDTGDLDLRPLGAPRLTWAPVAGVPFAEAKRQLTERFERTYLLAALRQHSGNVSRTAAAIGMVRQSLQQKIRELDLRDEDWS